MTVKNSSTKTVNFKKHLHKLQFQSISVRVIIRKPMNVIVIMADFFHFVYQTQVAV